MTQSGIQSHKPRFSHAKFCLEPERLSHGLFGHQKYTGLLQCCRMSSIGHFPHLILKIRQTSASLAALGLADYTDDDTGASTSSVDQLPYTTLNYANGPGHQLHQPLYQRRVNLTHNHTGNHTVTYFPDVFQVWHEINSSHHSSYVQE